MFVLEAFNGDHLVGIWFLDNLDMVNDQIWSTTKKPMTHFVINGNERVEL
jgi:hypothetical protein